MPAIGAADKPARNLALTVAILAGCVPDLGPRVDDALALARRSKVKSREGYFRTCMAQRLEFAGICAAGSGGWTLSMFQDALGSSVTWFEEHFEIEKPPAIEKPPEPQREDTPEEREQLRRSLQEHRKLLLIRTAERKGPQR